MAMDSDSRWIDKRQAKVMGKKKKKEGIYIKGKGSYKAYYMNCIQNGGDPLSKPEWEAAGRPSSCG